MKCDQLLGENVRSLGFEPRAGPWYKTESGFTLNQYCNEMRDCRCNSKWILKINLNKREAEFYFNKQCDHFNFDLLIN